MVFKALGLLGTKRRKASLLKAGALNANQIYSLLRRLFGLAVASYDLHAGDDDAAKAEARQFLASHPSVEDWDGPRWVARLVREERSSIRGHKSWAALARTGSGTNWRFVRTIEKLPAALQPLGCGDARPLCKQLALLLSVARSLISAHSAASRRSFSRCVCMTFIALHILN